MLSRVVGLSLTALASLAVLDGYAKAQTLPPPTVYPGCATLTQPSGRVYHVEPAVAGGVKNGLATMALTDALRLAHGGDVIYLKGGDYGAVTISGINASFVTLAPERGETPTLSQLAVGGYHPASHWQIVGLRVLGPSDAGLAHDGWQLHPPKVGISNSDNVILQNNTVGTSEGPYNWQPEVQGEKTVETLASGVGVEGSSCIAIVHNIIKNVFNGMTVGGDQTGSHGKRLLVADNIINGFAGDGIDHYASMILIQHNTILNGHDICKDTCIHTDGIQGWNWHDKAGIINTDVVIDGNLIIYQAGPATQYVADDLHGITIFDGNWDDVKIINNAIVTTAWHGISVYGGTRVVIANNSVASPDPKRAAWIMINHQKGQSSEVITNDMVRNNVASAFLNGQGGHPPVVGVTEDHNVVLRNPARTFSVFNVAINKYDLHPSSHSNLIGAGATVGMPTVDIDGRARTGPATVGAYGAPK